MKVWRRKERTQLLSEPVRAGAQCVGGRVGTTKTKGVVTVFSLEKVSYG